MGFISSFSLSITYIPSIIGLVKNIVWSFGLMAAWSGFSKPSVLIVSYDEPFIIERPSSLVTNMVFVRGSTATSEGYPTSNW